MYERPSKTCDASRSTNAAAGVKNGLKNSIQHTIQKVVKVNGEEKPKEDTSLREILEHRYFGTLARWFSLEKFGSLERRLCCPEQFAH